MEALEAFRFQVDVPVAWGDMDAFGHVNNVVYLRYFETARVAYFDNVQYIGTGTPESGPIIASVNCNYRRPVVYPDTLRVGVRCREPKTSSFAMEFVMVSKQHGAVVADGNAVIVNYDYTTGSKESVPDSLREALARMEGWVKIEP